MFNQALTLSAALLLWAPSVGAQQSQQDQAAERHEAGMMHGRGMDEGAMDMMRGDMGTSGDIGMSRDMGMMSSSAPGPAMLIRMGQVLDLTQKQMTDLEALQVELTEQRTSHMPLAIEAHQQAAELIAGRETDLAEYEATLREAMDHMVSVQVSVARAALDARAVLTGEQRTRLEDGMAMMRHMGSMRGGGMGRMSDQNSEDARHEHGASSGGNLGE